jgi:hypothetical protein
MKLFVSGILVAIAFAGPGEKPGPAATLSATIDYANYVAKQGKSYTKIDEWQRKFKNF